MTLQSNPDRASHKFFLISKIVRVKFSHLLACGINCARPAPGTAKNDLGHIYLQATLFETSKNKL